VSVAQRVAAEPLFTLRGLAMHLGSQITDVEPYHRGTIKAAGAGDGAARLGDRTIEALDVGGGLGVRYHNEKAPSPRDFADAVAPPIKQAGLALLCEPGRYLVANAGVLVTKVLYRKHAGGKDFVVVDAGMTDFVRPSHYNAHHEIVPLKDGSRPEELVNVWGPSVSQEISWRWTASCRGRARRVPGGARHGRIRLCDELDLQPAARPPEVLVEGDRYFIARQRESLDDLLRGEVLEPTTWYRAGGT